MRIRFFISLCLVFLFSLALTRSVAQVKHIWLSPGLKIGYTLGETGGFTIGTEISYVWEFNEERMVGMAGAVVGFDYCISSQRFKLNLGIEGPSPLWGASIGPTAIWEKGQTRGAITFALYVGAWLYLYFANTFPFDGKDILYEPGLYIKAPILLQGTDEYHSFY